MIRYDLERVDFMLCSLYKRGEHEMRLLFCNHVNNFSNLLACGAHAEIISQGFRRGKIQQKLETAQFGERPARSRVFEKAREELHGNVNVRSYLGRAFWIIFLHCVV